MRPSLPTLAAVLAFGCSGRGLEPVNIVFISIDSLRADHIGAYGYSRETSPTLDRLAAEGALFENAVALYDGEILFTDQHIASVIEAIESRGLASNTLVVRRTPVPAVDGPDFGLDTESLVLKLELFQHSGSFKARGAFANLLMRDVPKAGVVAASGGNHGAAVAFAARKLGIPARIFVPKVSSPSKIERIRSYGVELVVEGERYSDALAASEAWAMESGALPIHAYDRRETLLGQGTLALELSEQAPEIEFSPRRGGRRGSHRGNRLVVQE